MKITKEQFISYLIEECERIYREKQEECESIRPQIPPLPPFDIFKDIVIPQILSSLEEQWVSVLANKNSVMLILRQIISNGLSFQIQDHILNGKLRKIISRS